MKGALGPGKSPLDPYPSRLLEMEVELSKYLPNQREAINRVAKAIRKQVALCSENPHPLGRFLAVGPNNVATRLATGLAQFLFGDEKFVLELDMADYSERHQVLGLIGHGGGLVCSYFVGTLTEPIWRRPQTVIILSGIEKVHDAAWPILTEAMGEGVLIEGMGRSVSFTNTVFILTTMVGFAEGALSANLAQSAIECVVPAEMLHLICDILPLR